MTTPKGNFDLKGVSEITIQVGGIKDHQVADLMQNIADILCDLGFGNDEDGAICSVISAKGGDLPSSDEDIERMYADAVYILIPGVLNGDD